MTDVYGKWKCDCGANSGHTNERDCERNRASTVAYMTAINEGNARDGIARAAKDEKSGARTYNYGEMTCDCGGVLRPIFRDEKTELPLLDSAGYIRADESGVTRICTFCGDTMLRGGEIIKAKTVVI